MYNKIHVYTAVLFDSKNVFKKAILLKVLIEEPEPCSLVESVLLIRSFVSVAPSI